MDQLIRGHAGDPNYPIPDKVLARGYVNRSAVGHSYQGAVALPVTADHELTLAVAGSLVRLDPVLDEASLVLAANVDVELRDAVVSSGSGRRGSGGDAADNGGVPQAGSGSAAAARQSPGRGRHSAGDADRAHDAISGGRLEVFGRIECRETRLSETCSESSDLSFGVAET